MEPRVFNDDILIYTEFSNFARLNLFMGVSNSENWHHFEVPEKIKHQSLMPILIFLNIYWVEVHLDLKFVATGSANLLKIGT